LEEVKMVECSDSKCPIHGRLSVRGGLLTGQVVSAKPGKTVIVERSIVRYVPKYERYRKSKSRIYAHNPDCIGAKEGDIVKVGETRKLSKTKSFVVLEVTGKQKVVEIEEDTFRDKHRKKEKETMGESKKEDAGEVKGKEAADKALEEPGEGEAGKETHKGEAGKPEEKEGENKAVEEQGEEAGGRKGEIEAGNGKDVKRDQGKDSGKEESE